MHSKKAVFIAASLVLSACGGSSSSSPSSGNNGTGQPVVVDYAPVAGLYDASISGSGDDGVDESYLNISSDGEITAYNYLGDSVDAGDNCYREAVEGEINAQLTGETLEFDTASKEYYVLVNGVRTFWRINDSGTVTHVGYGSIVSGAAYTSSSSSGKVKIVTTPTTEITLDDILPLLCDD